MHSDSKLTSFASGLVYWVFLLFTGLPSFSQNAIYTPYTFTTIAGTPILGNVDGTNSAARFNEPESIARDINGNLYVADPVNQTIRKITASGTNWIVTTIAGTPGIRGSLDGPGSAALFFNPTGITVDTNGNVYVADSSNSEIRKLIPLGTNWIVSTIAGNPQNYGHADGTNQDAQFSSPESIAADPTGTLYVADSGNSLIRKMTPSGTNWIVTTIAGQLNIHTGADGTNGAATFDFPKGIAADTHNNVFVADSLNNTIRKIVLSGTNWVTTTIAGKIGNADSTDGTGTNALFNYPNGLTVDTNGNVYVADTENYTIRKLAPVGTNYVVTTPMGLVRSSGSTDGTNNNSRFYFATGVICDPAGNNLYVADYQNAEIRKATLSGTNWVVTTVAGYAAGIGSTDGTNGVARFDNPTGIAADSSGNLYVADEYNCLIRKLTPSGTNWIVRTIGGQPGNFVDQDGTNTSALFDNPYGIAVDTNGNLYVTDASGHTVRKFAPSGTNYIGTTLAGQYGSPGSSNGTNGAARFQFATSIAVDSQTNIFVADTGSSTIRKITPVSTNWVVTTIAGQVGVPGFSNALGTNSLFNYPMGICVDRSNNIYIADSGNDLIRKLTTSGTNYAASTVTGSLYDAGPADGTNSDAHFNYPEGIAIDSSGTLYIADYSDSTIRKAVPVGTNWVVTTLAGLWNVPSSADGTGMFAFFNHSAGIAVDSSGTVFVADTANSTIRRGVAVTQLLIGNPVVSGTHLDLPFTVINGSASTFKLLQAPIAGSLWTTNAAAVLTTNLAGSSYKYTVNYPNGVKQYYRVQTP